MDKGGFWSVIDRARGTTDPMAPSADPAELQAVLAALSDKEVAAFVGQFNDRLCELNTWGLWGAGYVLAGGMSDDGFHYFRSWVVGKGEKVHQAALADPDSVAAFVGDDDADLDNEALEYAALDVAEARGLGDPRDDGDGFPDDDPSGEEWDEETVAEAYPQCLKVAKRLGNWE